MADNVNVPEFIRLFTSHEARLSALALSLIPNWADAEEVLQQSNLIMDASLAYEMMTFNTKDHQEAIKAFVEKRKPNFVGNKE